MGPRVLLVITVFELKILPFFFLVGGFDISMEMQNRVRVTGAKQQLSGTLSVLQIAGAFSHPVPPWELLEFLASDHSYRLSF